MRCSLVDTLILLVLLAFPPNTDEAGINGVDTGYSLCQAACNKAWVTCCAASGVFAGPGGVATGGVGVSAAIMACNGLQGVCMTSCACSFLVAPTH